MNAVPNFRITFSDRMDNGIVVGFDDGKTAYYCTALVRATLAQAQMMPSDSDAGGQSQND